MKVGELSPAELATRAAGPGLDFEAGPFRILLKTRLRGMVDVFARLYAGFPLQEREGIHDFHVELIDPAPLRRRFRPQSHFLLDGQAPFEPYPLDHAFPLFEWGLNYAIATRSHSWCLLHSAVVEKDGRALLLPALPGSGKSTLCAALMQRGWRLLSDEFGILDPDSGLLQPMPRPIPLKNRSIDVMRAFAPEGVFGPRFPRTRKGDVVHLAPTSESVARQHQPARPGWVLFPRYRAGAATRITPVAPSQAFVRLSNNAFNYQLGGETAFRALAALIRRVSCHDLVYGDLEDVVARIEDLTR